MIQTPLTSRYGPWAVVTGASSGLGEAFAERLAAEGLHLVLSARREDRLAALGHRLTGAHGIEHRVVVADLSVPGGAERVVDAVDDLDVGLVVSNAGDGIAGDFVDRPLDEHDRDVQLNAISHLHLVHPLAVRMAARGRGGILLTAASGALHGMPHLANTAAAKGYLLHLGEGLHHELRPHGVDVTVLLPGNVDTPIVERLGLDPASLPVSLQPPAAAVDEALRALLRGKPMHVPGRLMRTAVRLTPRRLSIRLNGRMLAAAAANVAERTAVQSVG